MNATIETPARIMDQWALTVCLMAGTASFPQVFMRYFTFSNVRVARNSIGWSLVFIFVLYVTAPTLATLAKDNIYGNVIGCPIRDLPDWIFRYSKVNLLRICGSSPKNVADTLTACAGIGYAEDDPLRLVYFWIDADVVVLSTPEANDLPYTIFALTAAGGLLASISMANNLLLEMANSLSHDIWFKIIDPKASQFRRVSISRIVLIIIAFFCTLVASAKPADILSMVAWAFSIAAAGNFPALILGVWWKRTTGIGVIAGMLTGFPITLLYILGTIYMDWELWCGIGNVSAGIFGLPIGFLVTVVVSLLTPPPSENIQDFVKSLRELELARGLSDYENEGLEIEMGETNNAARPSYKINGLNVKMSGAESY